MRTYSVVDVQPRSEMIVQNDGGNGNGKLIWIGTVLSVLAGIYILQNGIPIVPVTRT